MSEGSGEDRVLSGQAASLPEGWRWVRLGEICQINPRRPSLRRSLDDATSFVPMAAVAEQGKGIAKVELRSYRDVMKGYTYFEDGDVIFAKITPCMQNGKHAIVRGLIDGIGFGSTEFHVLRPDEQVLAEWIHAFVVQPSVLDDAVAHFVGSAGQQRVPQTFLAALPIPLPPLAEQQRIAARLGAALAAVERARAAAVAQEQEINGYLPIVLEQTFASPMAEKWPKIAIGKLAATASGSTPSRQRPEFFDGRIPWVKTGELLDGVIHDTEEHVSERALAETSLKRYPPGTLLVAMYGQGQTRGRTGLLAVEATSNQACFAILPNADKFDARYLQWWFRANYERVRAASEGRGGNQPNLSGVLLRAERVPLLPVGEQRDIAKTLDEQEAVLRRAREGALAQLTAFDKIPAALLLRAFSGEV